MKNWTSKLSCPLTGKAAKGLTKLTVLIMVAAILGTCPVASASPIGLTPRTPDLLADTAGMLDYSATSHELHFYNAIPEYISFSKDDPFARQYFGGGLGERMFDINIRVDGAGRLLGSGTLLNDIGPVHSTHNDLYVYGTYASYTGLALTGTVTAFGWSETAAKGGQYDMQFTPTGGYLVTNGCFPDNNWMGTIISMGDGPAANWGGDFHQTMGLAESFPAPEPATMLLVGGGLLGLARFRRRNKK